MRLGDTFASFAYLGNLASRCQPALSGFLQGRMPRPVYSSLPATSPAACTAHIFHCLQAPLPKTASPSVLYRQLQLKVDCTESVPASAGTLAQNGLKVGGVKYMVIAGEPGAVHRGKKGAGEGWAAGFHGL